MGYNKYDFQLSILTVKWLNFVKEFACMIIKKMTKYNSKLKHNLLLFILRQKTRHKMIDFFKIIIYNLVNESI